MRRVAVAILVLAVPRVGFAQAPAPSPTAPPASPSPTEPAEPIPDARVAVQVEAARGRLTGDFRNQLLGVRVDLLFSPRVGLGGYVGYANLKGKQGRAHALLGYAQVEYLAPLAPALLNLRVPLRFGTGYLSHNGGVARAATGLAIALTPKLDLVSEILAPMVWVTNDQTLLSLNLSLELAARF
jgi:hypothetical protein